ncbi:hypothetical protein VD0002_g3548 [Verticillium dahliae]|uniref:Uncharacterized protein n=1 Tax=Verticillium dahliae TaxID=27337 RepID=A0A444S7B5_VERDA|nr:Lipase 1 [Verticillium dahliae VDG2]PNH33573.1 hypothetical protein BJF96_g3333 [Verticillium dahliae]PNH65474.1 hypothetical protein VD0002_g3548 [Verticillium dahliae]RXG49302.1 hypothetical protein VDGE_30730 [Verticillium dahliae]
MVDQHRPKIIEENPIKNGLDSFRASFKAICTSQGISPCPDSLGKLKGDELQNLALDLLLALQGCRASRLLRSGGRGKNLFGDLSTLSSAVNSDDFDFDRIKPLFNASLAEILNDALI